MKPSATRPCHIRRTLWKETINIALAVKRRTRRFVPTRGYAAEEIIEYLLRELAQELTQEEKKELETLRTKALSFAHLPT